MNALVIIGNIFDVIAEIFTQILVNGYQLVEWMFDWTANPYNVVIAIPLALMLIVFIINMIRRLIDGV